LVRCAVVAIVLVAACGDDVPPVPAEANPLGSTVNILPFPSSLYEHADGRLDVPVGAFPTNVVSKVPFDPTPLARRRGWPATTTLLWAAPGGVDPAGLVDHTRMADSVGAASATVIVDMTTGERVAHFAEVDVNELDHFERQAVYLRPAQRLVGGRRYAVGIRDTLRSRAGTRLPVTPGFAAVLADRDTGHARLDAARPRLRAAITALEAAGVSRDELLVAWDFTVTPDADAIAEPLAARAAALAAMGPLGENLAYTVTSDLGPYPSDNRIARRIELELAAPSLAGEGHAGYHRDASGAIVVQGTMTAKAYIMVPPCATFDEPAGILIYGHGFFGNLNELRGAEYARDLARDGCFVVAGTQWTGMSTDDIPDALLALNDLNKAWGFGERIWQGIANTMALAQLLRGKLASELLVDGEGRTLVDPARQVFLGISLGHILGSTFIAYDPFVTRGVLHVGAANWLLMFERSNNWAVYGLPLKSTYDDLLDAAIMEQILGIALEGVDGATVAGVELPDTPAKQMLVHTSIGDCAVPNLASFFQARSLGLDLISPAVTVPYGFADRQVASSERAWVIVDEQPTPLPPETNEVFSFDNVAHENPRRREAIQAQMQAFWATGVVTNTCTGPCDCAAGNCGALRSP
jgi:hypothetical protein